MCARNLCVGILLLGAMLAACEPADPPVQAFAEACAAEHFAGTTTAKSIPLMFRDCGTRTLAEAEALVAEYPARQVFLRPAGVSGPQAIAGLEQKSDVLVCNLSSNRGIALAAELTAPQVITGRSCLPLEGVTQVTVEGGRLASDPQDGPGGTAEWFGVAFVPAAGPAAQ